MLPKDNIYNFITKYRLPVSRGDRGVKVFLQEYYEKYIKELKVALDRDEQSVLRKEAYDLILSHVQIIEDLCGDIIKCFDYYDAAKMECLYKHFNDMMNRVLPYIYTSECENHNFYRIRAGAQDKMERKDLFHIPMTLRKLIKSYRYSIPGYPCLYLSTAMKLCWFECGMPKEFHYSIFKLKATQSAVKFIDFSKQPVDFVSSVHISYLNHESDDKTTTWLDEYVLKYLVSFPLMVACSISVVNRDVAFVEEYIFPQQFLLWVRDHTDFDGVLYRSCSSIEKAHEWNAINLVMPAKNIQNNGYCEYLDRVFGVSEPVRVDLSKLLIDRKEKYDHVLTFTSQLEDIFYNGYSVYPYRELLSLCKTFIHIKNMLENGNYVNIEAIYQTVETLNLFAYFVKDNKSSIQERAKKDAQNYLYNIDEKELMQEFNEILEKFEKEVCPVLFDFWGFSFLTAQDTGDLGKEYRSAINTDTQKSKPCLIKKIFKKD